MDGVKLNDLKMGSKKDVLQFLKRLWREEPTEYPIFGEPLELLHKGAKKNNCDWQCKKCDKTFKTIHLLDEMNEQLPD